MRNDTKTLFGLLLIALCVAGCSGRAAHNPVAHGSDEAAALLAASQPLHADTAIPTDSAPDLLTTYRFAPGDTLDLRVYGHNELNRGGIRIGADGTIDWLGMTGVPAAGLTVAELRAELEARLAADLLRRPVVCIRPDTIVGHRYYVMGKVIDKGSYPLDRPLRLLDAIARCRGIEVGLQDSSTVEIADFDHSLLIRDGAVVPVDFRALMMDGDLRYNIHVHPNDLLYFPSAMTNHVYVLGAVTDAGTQAYTSGMTMLGLLARQGGIERRAWRDRVVVLRGERANPQVFTVDVDAILAGALPDFRILPGDIVYLAEHPIENWRELGRVALSVFASVIGARAGVDTGRALP